MSNQHYTTAQARQALEDSAYCIRGAELSGRLAVHKIGDNKTIYGFRASWDRDALAQVISMWDAEKIDALASEPKTTAWRNWAVRGFLTFANLGGLAAIVAMAI